MSMIEKQVTLAAITGAHGVAGEVRLKLFGEGVAALKGHRAFGILGGDGQLTLKKVRDDGKGGAIARFDGINGRNEAEKLRGTALTVPRSALPALEEGEYYHADLIGLPAVSTSGEDLGTVIAVENFGAQDIVEIERPGVDGKRGKRFMIPMNADAVPEWDAERLVVSDDFCDI
ncbi:MAG: 16S rRNA processing protein RimM [Sphingomonadaceae bacterium]|nr:16S rRNA processing protein RimM [Sphingomonadaceae bacterium]